MQPISIQEPAPRQPPRGFALFALGFRPFFLLGGVAGALLMGLWLLFYGGGSAAAAGYYGPVGWHAHEMVFGYTLAVVAGFLLTAARNWTGVDTLGGRPLALLAGLWVLARLLPLLAAPGWLIAVVDWAFLPAVAAALFLPIHQVRHVKSYVFVLLLGLAAVANLLVHLDALGLAPGWERPATYAAVGLVMVVVAIMGGRVIPFFIEMRLGQRVRTWPRLDAVAVWSVGAFALLEAVSGWVSVPWLTFAVAAVAAIANAARWWGWHLRGVWSEPLLWVLFLGYGWLVLGLALKALAAFAWVSPFLALHALTAGAIGVLTLGMMPRVSLGHTGRDMRAPRFIPAAFVLVNLAVALRVLAPLVWPDAYRVWIMASGTAWMAAFAIFVVTYAPMLWRPRVDGRPG